MLGKAYTCFSSSCAQLDAVASAWPFVMAEFARGKWWREREVDGCSCLTWSAQSDQKCLAPGLAGLEERVQAW